MLLFADPRLLFVGWGKLGLGGKLAYRLLVESLMLGDGRVGVETSAGMGGGVKPGDGEATTAGMGGGVVLTSSSLAEENWVTISSNRRQFSSDRLVRRVAFASFAVTSTVCPPPPGL
jgi:hypothetical protein